MITRIEVFSRLGTIDPKAEAIRKNIAFLGYKKAEVFYRMVYFIEADISKEESQGIASLILSDPISENYSLFETYAGPPHADDEVEITYNPGVMDPVSQSVKLAIENLLGKDRVKNVRTAKRISIQGLSYQDLLEVTKSLYNPLIEHVVEYRRAKNIKTLDEFMNLNYQFEYKEINLLKASSLELEKIGRDGLSLNLAEMKAIQGYFSLQKRNPSDCELETIAQTWSEHCMHKTFRGLIDYKEIDSKDKIINEELIDNLLKDTVMKVTNELKAHFCVSVFDDNSGIIRFDEQNDICFKVETHNHPSALEPYGGASTGIGGVIRDILGTGLGAYPIASTDVFCFADPNFSGTIPEGVIHPRRIIKGVVEGVRDYGNKMGIPTVNGAVLFDKRFLGNPLVFCGNVGIMPKDKAFKKVTPGDLIVVLGGRTGKDGIHGATFSSAELDTNSVEVSSSAVQIGNPIEEKKMVSAIIRARDENLFPAITDCGAGGLSSAVGEITKDHGCRVFLDKVPLKYKGLSYTEIWISESQERMVLVIRSENLKRFQEILDEEDVEFAVIGEVARNKKLQLFFGSNKVCDLDMDFLHKGVPKIKRRAVWNIPDLKKVDVEKPSDYNFLIKKLLSSLNISSKEWIIRQYDHEVLSATSLKPLMGKFSGPMDAAVIKPLQSSKAIAIGCGINPFYSDIDPYHMAGLVIDEALRNVVAVGADVDRIAILDNFCWGSPEDEKVLGSLVRASKGCYHFAKGFGVPFISGKDSLYNEYKVADEKIVIPGTLLISSIAVIDDISKCITSSFKRKGNLIYILGDTKEELGASEYLRILNLKGGILPLVDIVNARNLFNTLHKTINLGLVRSCHDCSEGGLAVALAEMSISSGLGCEVFLREVPNSAINRDDYLLFSETPSRFIVEVDKERRESFENMFKGLTLGLIGCVSSEEFKVYGLDNKEIINIPHRELEFPWKRTFNDW